MALQTRLAGEDRLRFIEHQGVRILWSDLSRLDGAELRGVLEQGIALARRHPPDSLLILVDVHGIPYRLENVAVLRHAATKNRPYVRARAVIGLPEIAHFSFRVVAHASGLKMEAFGTMAAALDWLADQA